FLRMALETPAEDSVILSDAILRVAGWAVAHSGIKHVAVWLDEDGPHTAHYGLLREEAGLRYSEVPGASHSGFLWACQIGHLAPGVHRLRLLCTAHSGLTAEANASFQIDSQSEYELWAALNQPERDQLLTWHQQAQELPYTPLLSIITPVAAV